MPVDDAQPSLYGSGYINGTIIGIPKGGESPGSGVAGREVPDDRLALPGAVLERDPERPDDEGLAPLAGAEARRRTSQPFLKIFSHPKSWTSPITAAGVAYTNLVQNFFTKWQAGQVSDLQSGLKQLDKQLDALVKQAKGGGVP